MHKISTEEVFQELFGVEPMDECCGGFVIYPGGYPESWHRYAASLDTERSSDGLFIVKSMLEVQELLSTNENIYKKDRDMLCTFDEVIVSHVMTPLVDKGSQMVFFVNSGNHESLMALLYKAHQGVGYMHNDEAARLYVDEGLGYFMNTMNHQICVGENYQSDKTDDGIFATYGTIGLDVYSHLKCS